MKRTAMRIAILPLIATALLTSGCTTTGQSVAAGDWADRLEPGLQGQQMAADNPGAILPAPYSKGLRRIGHSPVSGRDSNVQMVWAGHCAYIASSSPNFMHWGGKSDPATYGVAVIDVSDPRNPRQTALLREAGALYAAETIDAVQAPDGRRVLVAGAYHDGPGSAMPNSKPAMLAIYDLTDCAHPKLTAETAWPGNSHTVSLSPDGRTVYGTNMSPFTGSGGLQVMDISDLARPRFMGKFGATRADGTSFEFASHEVRFSADGKRIYAGVISSRSEHFNNDIALMPPSARLLGNEGGGVLILDSSDIAARRPEPKLRLVSASARSGWHTVVPARIGGVPYLVGGSELTACPGTWPRLTNIADETKPVLTGEFRLAMNHAENCSERTATEKASSGISPSPGTATLHYNDVDSATDTRLGLFNFLWAGLRIADLRNPAAPGEVAYFKPGDMCTGHVRYVPQSGHIWLVCQASGFHVLELNPRLRAALGMPKFRGR